MGKLLRFRTPKGKIHYGRWDGTDPVEALTGPAWTGGQPTGERFNLADIKLLAPCEPTKIVCVGRNYAAHALELGNEIPLEPLIFLKPPSSVIGPGEAIVKPRGVDTLHHEAELAIVIGRRCRRVTAAYARSFGTGMTCLNDVTARDIQQREKHFTRAKGFDTFCPVGPWIEEGPVDAGSARIRCKVNGDVRQVGQGSDMIVDPWDLVAFVSQVMTLEPGDIVTTGTPAGAGPLAAGDVVEVEIDGIGILANPVVADA